MMEIFSPLVNIVSLVIGKPVEQVTPGSCKAPKKWVTGL
jgi:hypothetical protein